MGDIYPDVSPWLGPDLVGLAWMGVDFLNNAVPLVAEHWLCPQLHLSTESRASIRSRVSWLSCLSNESLGYECLMFLTSTAVSIEALTSQYHHPV